MFTDEQKGLLATGIIKAEGNMTSGDAHLAVNFPLLLEKGLDGLREKVSGTSLAHQSDGAGRFTWRAIPESD